MKKLIYIMYMIWVAVWTVSCSKEEGLADQPETDSGFDLVFAAQGEDLTLSRTTLQGPEALQHVSTVYLYIFEGTDTDATCVAVEDVYWPYWENAQDGKPTLEHKYRVKYMGFSAGEQYTFVAMGLDNTRTAAGIEDNNSKYTYGLPESIGVGTKLSELQVAVQAKCNRMDIAKSEWFAGSLELSGEQILAAKAETLNLYRRVAGVMGYFTDVPDGVTKLQICLYQRQNTKAWVLPQPEINGEFKDYVEFPGENTNQAGQNGDTGESTDWQVLVELNAEDIEDMPGSGLGVVGSVIIGGSYVLPARASAVDEETTLCLKLIGNNENTTLIRKIYQQTAYAPVQASLSRGETDEGTGIIGGDDDSQGPDDEEYKYHYPIIANHFYSIGTKDNPVSLADNGEIFVIINAGWDDEHNIVIKPSGN
ncbi:FimB/Mfa2 family fimbrial subunit [Phocaeicola barnesiae]|uniref:FimB/Mfa2 family fimbrial subunit n=1 Tax=Phocaeicola barnesiae TaxID=376804 RepID=A0AAW5NAG5_9BACT|nr:FimB/Mfa2 family fimbrial subunit [Phocaeicola barnesiae]MCR8875089.1 FimB/Mfa2 family fimbrial subunit [Phocaeicola barnesiae]